MTAVERLEMGVKRIREGGWLIGNLRRGTKYCALGSLMTDDEISEQQHAHSTTLTDGLQEALSALELGPCWAITQWNDHPIRTVEEVIARLDTAAGLLRAQEFANTPQPEIVLDGALVKA